MLCRYMPPELMAHGQVTKATDVYSFGVLMWELLCCEFAFHSESAAQIFWRVVHMDERPVLPEGLDCPAEIVSLMHRCWVADPAAR
jgi:serine/threonine protein kinase